MKILPLKTLCPLFIFCALAGCSSTPPATTPDDSLNERDNGNGEDITIIASNLEVPWALDFLPDGSVIFTERPGRIKLAGGQEGLAEQPLLIVDEAVASGEGGVLGVVLHPEFGQNGYVYVYYTYESADGLANKVVRYTMEGETLSQDKVIIEGIPGASIHNGGRLKFGPDDKLYITAGDAGNSDYAQDRDTLAGKILRLNEDGSVPGENPFEESPVYSYGHRNPQGIAWDDAGRMWATEHGSSATDELNLIEPGKNYGWPVIRGDEEQEGMMTPVIHSGSDTWAPGGIAYLDGSLYFSGLRGSSLYRVDITSDPFFSNRHFSNEYGRLRAAAVGPDGYLYITTSNRDGRGSPAPDDDRIIRINPEIFEN